MLARDKHISLVSPFISLEENTGQVVYSFDVCGHNTKYLWPSSFLPLSIGIRTLDLTIMSWLFYHCAIRAQPGDSIGGVGQKQEA